MCDTHSNRTVSRWTPTGVRDGRDHGNESIQCIQSDGSPRRICQHSHFIAFCSLCQLALKHSCNILLVTWNSAHIKWQNRTWPIGSPLWKRKNFRHNPNTPETRKLCECLAIWQLYRSRYQSSVSELRQSYSYILVISISSSRFRSSLWQWASLLFVAIFPFVSSNIFSHSHAKFQVLSMNKTISQLVLAVCPCCSIPVM